MKDATSAIVLTHNVDFRFLQSVVYPRLQKCGAPKLTIFAEATCTSGAYSKHRSELSGLGNKYRIVNVDMGTGRRFHPKAILLTGPNKAALAVGSGNLSYTGWSANQEIWACYESNEDGLKAISSFKDYLGSVLDLVTESHTIREEVGAAFDENANGWASNMPHPEKLIGTPHMRPLIDQIDELVESDVQKITACAPYFDKDGKALSALSDRFKTPVIALLQQNHVGLTEEVANNLPEKVVLKCVEVNPHRFIHAKLYAFQQPHFTTLFVGSANMSRAALLANDRWGNAELMAVEELPSETVDQLFLDGLTILKEPPNFPKTPPSDEWEVTQRKCRIIAARYSAGILEIVYNVISKVVQLHVQIDGELMPITEVSKRVSTKASQHFISHLEIEICPRSIQLHCKLESSETELSDHCWVDNEHNLSITTLERRFDLQAVEVIRDRLPLKEGLLALIKRLSPHLRQSIKSSNFNDVKKSKDDSTAGPSFLKEDIFSDNDDHLTDKRRYHMQSHRKFDNTQLMKFVRHQFEGTSSATLNRGNENASIEISTTNEDDDETDRDPETEEMRNESAKKEHEKRIHHRETHAKQRKTFIKELKKVSSAVSRDSFFSSRSPERLQGDLIVLALFFRLGLQENFLSKEEFAEETLSLWSAIFFGSENRRSSLEMHLSPFSQEKKNEFISKIMSPDLTASLILWCFPSWGSTGKHTIKFRFSSVLLAERYPWLVDGGAGGKDEVHSALLQFSRVVPEEDAFDTLIAAWRRWKQSAYSVQKLKQELKSFSATRLSEMVSQMTVEKGDLLIQNDKFYVSEVTRSCNSPTPIEIYSLVENSKDKFCRNRLVPVVDLLRDDNLLNLDSQLRAFLKKFLSEVKEYSTEIRPKSRQSTRTQEK